MQSSEKGNSSFSIFYPFLRATLKERERQIPNDITYMWNLKYGTNEPLYKTERES